MDKLDIFGIHSLIFFLNQNLSSKSHYIPTVEANFSLLITHIHALTKDS